MESLPFELYCQVLGWLDAESFVRFGACAPWTYRLMKKPQTKQTLGFTAYSNRNMEDVARLTSAFTQTLRITTLRNCHINGSWSFLRRCSNLRRFSLSGQWPVFDMMDLSCLPKLQRIDLEGVDRVLCMHSPNPKKHPSFPRLTHVHLIRSSLLDLSSFVSLCPHQIGRASCRERV